jgi:hypothetical protein
MQPVLDPDVVVCWVVAGGGGGGAACVVVVGGGGGGVVCVTVVVGAGGGVVWALDAAVEAALCTAALCAAALARGCGLGLAGFAVVVVAVVAVVVVDVVVVDWAAAAGAAVWLVVDEAEPHALTMSVSRTVAIGMRRCLIGVSLPPGVCGCLKGRRPARVASREIWRHRIGAACGSGPAVPGKFGSGRWAGLWRWGRIPKDLNNR